MVAGREILLFSVTGYCGVLVWHGKGTVKTFCKLTTFFFLYSLLFFKKNFKVFIEFVTVLLLLFMLWLFGHEACGISAPQEGIEPSPPALEGEISTTGPPGKPEN